MNEKLIAVIVAAGSGTRLNSRTPKVFININHKPVLWYSIKSFSRLNYVKNILVLVSKNNIKYLSKFKKKYKKLLLNKTDFLYGGDERSDSVFNALNYIKKNKIECDYVAIHDAARPAIKPSLIDEIYKEAIKYNAAAPGIQVVDTIKEINNDFMIKNHIPRESLISIQTPQIFKFENIFKAYTEFYLNKKLKFTDDTEVYGKIYDKIKIILGSNDLLKITYKKDIKVLKSILKNNFKE